MLTISLILSAVLLTATNLIAYRSKCPDPMIVLLCVVFLFGSQSFGVLPPVIWLSLLLPVASGARRVKLRGPAFFRSLSLGATLIAFGIPTVMAIQNERDYARLRVRYPFESMEDRLPTPKPSSRETPPTPAPLSRLSQPEEQLGGRLRSLRLKRLHEDAVGLFVRSFGFGVGRMVPTYPSESNLVFGEPPNILQPGPRIVLERSPGEWTLAPIGGGTSLGRFHEAGVVDFADPREFGYFKDRRHVAGFEPHRFSEVPELPGEVWKVQTLDLVGLLLEDEPRVYVSAHLPRMDALRSAPTRPLDKFEAVGLIAIRGGDDLVIARDGEIPRMLGAIRNARQCVDCHGGERGDLLGAFTYTFRCVEKTVDDLL